jgi:SPP1 family predicted phage head-tail adaptor
MAQTLSLRHRVTIQRLVERPLESPPADEQLFDWDDYITVWAAIKPISAREFMGRDQVLAEVSEKIIMRWRSGIDATMRILYRGDVYNIEGILPDDKSGREWLTLMVSRGTNEG